jgi:DNA-directed RNA polymerase I subunit RPA43
VSPGAEDAADLDADMDAAEAAEMTADPDADDAAPGWGADALAMGGRWLARAGGAPLGGAARSVEFVVTALAVSNAMLSLRGSLQPDPFDARHVPDTPAPVRAEEEEERPGSATAIEVDGDDSAVDSDADGDAFTREDEVDGPEEDQAATFARLGRLADREKEKRAQDKEARKGKSKERKRAAKDAEEGGAEKKKKKKKVRKEE